MAVIDGRIETGFRDCFDPRLSATTAALNLTVFERIGSTRDSYGGEIHARVTVLSASSGAEAAAPVSDLLSISSADAARITSGD
jgi:hypothetical protein